MFGVRSSLAYLLHVPLLLLMFNFTLILIGLVVWRLDAPHMVMLFFMDGILYLGAQRSNQWFLAPVVNLNFVLWQILLLNFYGLFICFTTYGSIPVHLRYFFVITTMKFSWLKTPSPTNVQRTLTLIITLYVSLFFLANSKFSLFIRTCNLLTSLRKHYLDHFLLSFDPSFVLLPIPRLACGEMLDNISSCILVVHKLYLLVPSLYMVCIF